MTEEYVACRHCRSQVRLDDGITRCEACGYWYEELMLRAREASQQYWWARERERIDEANRRAAERVERVERMKRASASAMRSQAARRGWQTRRERDRACAQQNEERRFWDQIAAVLDGVSDV